MKFFNKCRNFAKAHSFAFTSVLCLALVLIIAFGLFVNMLFTLDDKEKSEILENLKSDKEFMTQFENSALGFSDPYLVWELTEALDCSVSQLTQSKMSETLGLSISNNPYIQSLDDLRYFTSIESLSITDCMLKEVSPVFALNTLKTLSLKNNVIKSVDGIEKLQFLEKLDLSENRISDVSFLSKLPLLIEADISKNFAEKISSLKDSETLIELDLAENRLDSLSFMVGNKSITSLDVSGNDITALDDLAGCEVLEKLYLYKYLDMDLTPLHNLPAFNSIFLSETFDRSKIDFMIGNFSTGDKYTRIYLVSKARGLDTND